MTLRPRLATPALVVVAAISLTLAACGGGTGSGTSTSAERKREEESVKFTRCLREHGLNASTAANGGTIRITGGVAAAGGGSGPPPALEAAMKACEKYRPAPEHANLSPAEEAQRKDAALKFSQCMRSHGVDIPNPSPGRGNLGIRIKGGPGKLNPESPTFQAAQKACQGLLPGKGGGFSTQKAGAGKGPQSGAVLSIAPGTKSGGG